MKKTLKSIFDEANASFKTSKELAKEIKTLKAKEAKARNKGYTLRDDVLAKQINKIIKRKCKVSLASKYDEKGYSEDGRGGRYLQSYTYTVYVYNLHYKGELIATEKSTRKHTKERPVFSSCNIIRDRLIAIESRDGGLT